LRAIRHRWLKETLDKLERDATVIAAGLVGSLGRGTFDDWSDVDILIVVPDDQVDAFSDARLLPGAGELTLSFDARQNSPRGTGAVSGQYLLDGLPLWVDWYVYRLSQAGWVSDSKVVFDRQGIPGLDCTFDDHLARRQVQDPTPKPEHTHRLLQIALIPVAGKRVARRALDTGRMIEFLGGPPLRAGGSAEHLAALERLVVEYRDDGPVGSLQAARTYLRIVEAVLTGRNPA
jgi:hypothetical protein